MRKYSLCFLLLSLMAPPVFAENISCPTLDDLRQVMTNRLTAYVIADFKHAPNNAWSIKPVEFKVNDQVWKLGIGPIQANSDKNAVTAAKQLVLSSNRLINKPESATNYGHAWCYYSDKNSRPLVFAISPIKPLG